MLYYHIYIYTTYILLYISSVHIFLFVMLEDTWNFIAESSGHRRGDQQLVTCELALGPGASWDGAERFWDLLVHWECKGWCAPKSCIDLETPVENTRLRNIDHVGCPESICDRGIWIWGGEHSLLKICRICMWHAIAQFLGVSFNPTDRCIMIMRANG